MKLCATCQNKYPDDANFCPRAECAGQNGPQRLVLVDPPARFVPVSKLGGGSTGEVWQASDSQSSGGVAYKVLSPAVLPTSVAVDRALRELRQLQRASSPRIVKVIDFGKTPDGRVFVASELTEGVPLDQMVASTGPLPLDRAKRVVAQIGEALLDAQKVGVVHRDLSAKNVLISRDDEVRLINFVAARPVSETVFGVPEFMSPEQAMGKLIDQRSNTYSVGALMYLMLTGQAPFVGASPQATIDAVLKAEITPPSIKCGAGLTAEVDRVILKALERNSSRRPLTMRQFLSDVAALIVTEEQAGAATSASSGRDAAFAKTMMFAGGAAEVQKLVAQAVAARQAADRGDALAAVAADPPRPATSAHSPPRSSTPASLASGRAAFAAPGAGATPSPAGRPSHGAAVSATMISMPVTGPMGVVNPTADPPRPTSSETPTVTSGTPGQTTGGNFRETLWFKKGDVDQMVADARAKVEAIVEARKVAEAAAASGDAPASLEDLYSDDGTVTADDRKNFSLKSGRTSIAAPQPAGSVPGERMTDSEVLDEIGGGKRFLILGTAGAVAVALVAVVVMYARGKGHHDARLVPSATTEGAPPALVEKTTPPPVPPPPPPAAVEPAGTPSAAPEGAANEQVAPTPAKAKPAVRHHTVSKKRPAPGIKKPHR